MGLQLNAMQTGHCSLPTLAMQSSDAHPSLQGLLRGYDQTNNLVLEGCHERVFSTKGVDLEPLGLYMIRGDNVAIIGEVDEDLDASIDFSSLQAAPLKPIHQ